VLVCALGGCAAYESDRHLAPIYTRMSLARGDLETEAAGGALIVRREPKDEAVRHWGLRPLYTKSIAADGSTHGHMLPPLGETRSAYDSYYIRLTPFGRYHREKKPSGFVEWTWFSLLPPIYLAAREDQRFSRAFFPFFGRIVGFFSFDSYAFVLWPIFSRSERQGRTAWHWFFPFFSRASGRGGTSIRVFPIYGHSKYEGRYDRRFVLWPFFHHHRNNLKADPEEQETKWMVWPFFGRTAHGSFRSTSVLWPFFGYARDPSTGFEAWDGPWPLVRVQRPGTNAEAGYRSRVWPFYSYFEADGLTSVDFLWPFGNVRVEEYEEAHKKNTRFIPLWQNWVKVETEGGEITAYRKLWPLFKAERVGERRSFAFPALNPLWRTPNIDYHWAWLWELWHVDVDGESRQERSWLGFWRREKDADEDRRSLVGVWANRRYSFEGDDVSETSILFGLVRWRTREDHGVQFLPPSLPGPGWPSKRIKGREAFASVGANQAVEEFVR
jgi:hypothetical protein